MEMVQRAAGKLAAYFVFVVLIMAEFLMAKLEFMVVAFCKATGNSTRGVHRIHTRSVHYKHHSLLTSANACLWLKSLTAQDCNVIIVRMKIVPSSGPSPFNPPQHEAPPGLHDLLQDDVAHRAPLPGLVQSTSSAIEPLSHVNFESDRNPRTKTPTGYEPTELATTSGSSLEDIYQLYDVQR